MDGENRASDAPALRAVESAVSRPGRDARAGATRARKPDPLRELALAAAQGDRAATEALVSALAPLLLGVARRILGGRDADVEDATQESLIAVVRALGAFRGDSSVGHYAKRIAARTCLGVRKRRSVREKHAANHERLEVERQQTLPSETTASQRRRQALRALLDQLPVEQAETLTLRIILGMSLAEVGEATGAPVNTVRSRIRLARESLRKRIDSDPATAALLGETR